MNFSELSFKEKYNYFLSLVNSRLDEVVSSNKFELLGEPLRYFLSNQGKRIRPVLTLISYGAIENRRPPLECIDVAVAIEILHNFTLIHDDIMDKSSLRRGQQTIHKKWNEQTAILLGDIMIGYSYQLLQNSCRNFPNFLLILDTFTDALIKVCEGQTLDMHFETQKNVTIENYFEMIKLKTAKMIESAVLIGAYCSNPKEEQLSALSQYAINLGIAFQLQDDLLDLTAKEEKFGKKLGQDLIDGKKTFIILKALEKIDDFGERKKILEVVENRGVAEEKVPEIIYILEKNNILADAKEEALKHLETARRALHTLAPNDYVQMLNDIVDYLVGRER